jgi:hypothetical protein
MRIRNSFLILMLLIAVIVLGVTRRDDRRSL